MTKVISVLGRRVGLMVGLGAGVGVAVGEGGAVAASSSAWVVAWGVGVVSRMLEGADVWVEVVRGVGSELASVGWNRPRVGDGVWGVSPPQDAPVTSPISPKTARGMNFRPDIVTRPRNLQWREWKSKRHDQ